MKAGDLATICSPTPGSTCGWGYKVSWNGRWDQREGLRQIPNGTHCLIINHSCGELNPIVLAQGELFEIAPKSLQRVGR